MDRRFDSAPRRVSTKLRCSWPFIFIMPPRLDGPNATRFRRRRLKARIVRRLRAAQGSRHKYR